jgi:hypothetical protein
LQNAADNNNNDPFGLNVIIGTHSYTRGTSAHDSIIGCPASGDTDSTCNVGYTLLVLGGNDILQGSIENDYLYSDNAGIPLMVWLAMINCMESEVLIYLLEDPELITLIVEMDKM